MWACGFLIDLLEGGRPRPPMRRLGTAALQRGSNRPENSPTPPNIRAKRFLLQSLHEEVRYHDHSLKEGAP
jgi:hypothetical protein